MILHRDGMYVMLKQAEDPKHVVPRWTVSDKLWNICPRQIACRLPKKDTTIIIDDRTDGDSCPGMIAALLTLVKLTEKVLFGSGTVSPQISTPMVLDVCPAVNVSIPLTLL